MPKKAPARGVKSASARESHAGREAGKRGRTIHPLESTTRGHVHVYAAGAVELDRVDAGQVTPAARDELVGGAVDARALTKVGGVEFGVL